MRFSGVPETELAAVWDRVEPYITKAAERGGDFTANSILRALIKTDAQLWIAHEGEEVFGVAVTRLILTEGGKVCTVFIGTGRQRKRWQYGLRDLIESWARDQDCRSVRVIARPGWERIYTTYKRTHSILERLL